MKQETQRITLDVPVDSLEKLSGIAAKQYRSRSRLILMLIEGYLALITPEAFDDFDPREAIARLNVIEGKKK